MGSRPFQEQVKVGKEAEVFGREALEDDEKTGEIDFYEKRTPTPHSIKN